jgi:exopolysaccharide biosynthesis polyprenyl glycosylphosphotransferase
MTQALSESGNSAQWNRMSASTLPTEALEGDVLAALPSLQALPPPTVEAVLPRLRRRARFGPRLALVLSDALVLTVCIVAAMNIPGATRPHVSGSRDFANVEFGALVVVVALVAFALNNLYSKSPGQVLKNSFTELHDVVYGLGIAGCVALAIHYWFWSAKNPLSILGVTVVVALLFAAVLVPIGRAVTRSALRVVRLEQFRVLIVGSGMMARHLERYLSWDSRIRVVGCVDDDPTPGTSVLGSIEDLPALVRDLHIDQVMVGFSRTHPAEAIRRLQSLNNQVAISIVPRYFELLTWRSQVKEIAGLALIDVAPARLNLGARFAKRTFDVVVGSLSLLLALPVLALAAIAIKLTSPGPVLFRQERIGRDNRPFMMYKLRTMTLDAEDARSELDTANEVDGPLFKMRVDPRVTRVGRFLRRSSLDEVPQLLNVLRGDMALVGPRPFIAEESSTIDGSAQRRFEVRPGMTGLWQVSGRSELTFDELQRLDYLYVASWSIWWDLRILWNTPARVIRGRGAF